MNYAAIAMLFGLVLFIFILYLARKQAKELGIQNKK